MILPGEVVAEIKALPRYRLERAEDDLYRVISRRPHAGLVVMWQRLLYELAERPPR